MLRSFSANKSADLSLSSASSTTISTEALGILPTDVEVTLDPAALDLSIDGLEGTISNETEALAQVAVDVTAEATDSADDANDQATEIAVTIPEILASANAELEGMIADIDANVFAELKAESEATFEGAGDSLDGALDASIEAASELDSNLTIIVEDAGIAGEGIIAGAGEVVTDVNLTLDTAGDGTIDSLSDTAAEIRATIDTGMDSAEDGIDLALEVSGDAESAIEVALGDIEDYTLDLQATIGDSELVTATTEVATDLQIALEGTMSGPVADLGASILGEDDGILAEVVSEAGEISVALLGDDMSGDDDLSILLDLQSDDDDLMEDVIEDEAIVELGLF